MTRRNWLQRLSALAFGPALATATHAALAAADAPAAAGATDWKRLGALGIEGGDSPRLAALLAGDPAWAADEALAQALREPLLRLGARYLSEARRGDRPVDSVARFHLDNGARLERLNPRGNLSRKGLKQSHGLMVNYLYDLDRVEEYHQRFLDGVVVHSQAVARLA